MEEKKPLPSRKKSPAVDPTEEVYEDDLRAGKFRFTDVESDAEYDLKPYEVIFNVAAGRMSWCYPEPRLLQRVQVFPVPFVAVSENSWDLCPSHEVGAYVFSFLIIVSLFIMEDLVIMCPLISRSSIEPREITYLVSR